MRIVIFIIGLFASIAMQAQNTKTMKPLTPEEKRVIVNKGTEAPFTGKYHKNKEAGTYLCRQCGAPLYRSSDKFDSGCGWPSFDDEISGAVKRTRDADGQRTEITCTKCGGHLGHVFMNEGFTTKNTRHCVNSVSLEFVPVAEVDATAAKQAPNSSSANVPVSAKTATPALAAAAAVRMAAQASKPAAEKKTDTAIFAGGCFWGVEYMLSKIPGVISVESGYTGGKTENPTYEQVCSHRTGHAEAVLVTFDPAKVSYETLAKTFFETHDPTQADGQGPDIGDQYRSEVYYNSPEQKLVAEKLIAQLRAKGYDVVTAVTHAAKFWPAEKYHQDYYDRKGTQPYCHAYTKRF